MTEDEAMFEAPKRKRGRPATGTGRKVDVRISEDLAVRVQRHADANFQDWADAIRALIERGLNGDRK